VVTVKATSRTSPPEPRPRGPHTHQPPHHGSEDQYPVWTLDAAIHPDLLGEPVPENGSRREPLLMDETLLVGPVVVLKAGSRNKLTRNSPGLQAEGATPQDHRLTMTIKMTTHGPATGMAW
jgi:hypothetical protein